MRITSRSGGAGRRGWRLAVSLLALVLAAVAAPAAERTADLSREQFTSGLVFVSVETAAGRATASGFLTRQGTRLCVITSLHPLTTARQVSLRNLANTTFRIVGLEVAARQNLARLTVVPEDAAAEAGLAPLEIAERTPAIDDRVLVYGDSKGAGTMTRLAGKVLAVGTETFDISTAIAPGTRGGPILDTAGKVIGVCALAEAPVRGWLDEGRRRPAARRLGERLTPTSAFLPVETAAFLRQGEQLAQWDALRAEVAADYTRLARRKPERPSRRADDDATPLEQARAWKTALLDVVEPVRQIQARVTEYDAALEQTPWLCGYLAGEAAARRELAAAALSDIRQLRRDLAALLEQADSEIGQWCRLCGGLGGRRGISGKVQSRCMECGGTGRNTEARSRDN
jgi:hypothetical protein